MTTTATTVHPPHPGAELWDDYLDPLNLTVGEAAAALGVSRKTISAIVNGRQAISADMSVRLSKALGGDPHEWALKQLAYDIATISRRRIRVKRLVPTT